MKKNQHQLIQPKIMYTAGTIHTKNNTTKTLQKCWLLYDLHKQPQIQT